MAGSSCWSEDDVQQCGKYLLAVLCNEPSLSTASVSYLTDHVQPSLLYILRNPTGEAAEAQAFIDFVQLLVLSQLQQSMDVVSPVLLAALTVCVELLLASIDRFDSLSVAEFVIVPLLRLVTRAAQLPDIPPSISSSSSASLSAATRRSSSPLSAESPALSGEMRSPFFASLSNVGLSGVVMSPSTQPLTSAASTATSSHVSPSKAKAPSSVGALVLNSPRKRTSPSFPSLSSPQVRRSPRLSPVPSAVLSSPSTNSRSSPIPPHLQPGNLFASSPTPLPPLPLLQLPAASSSTAGIASGSSGDKQYVTMSRLQSLLARLSSFLLQLGVHSSVPSSLVRSTAALSEWHTGLLQDSFAPSSHSPFVIRHWIERWRRYARQKANQRPLPHAKLRRLLLNPVSDDVQSSTAHLLFLLSSLPTEEDEHMAVVETAPSSSEAMELEADDKVSDNVVTELTPVASSASRTAPPFSVLRTVSLLDILLSVLSTLTSEEARHSSHFFAVFAELLNSSSSTVVNATYKRRCVIRGVLPVIMKRISEQLTALTEREAINSSTVLSRSQLSHTSITQDPSFCMYGLSSLLIDLLSVPEVKRSFLRNPSYSSALLSSYLIMRGLVFARSRLTELTTQHLHSLVTLLFNAEDKRSAIRAYLHALNDSHAAGPTSPTSASSSYNVSRSLIYIIQQLVDIIRPPQPSKHYQLLLRKSPTQEEFIRGNMRRSPYSSSSFPGPLFRDIVELICGELKLTNEDNMFELLVAGKIISLDLPISKVYEKVWRPHVAQQQHGAVLGSGLGGSGMELSERERLRERERERERQCFDMNTEVLIRLEWPDGPKVGWMNAETVLALWRQPATRAVMQIASLRSDAAGEQVERQRLLQLGDVDAAGAVSGSLDRLVYAPLIDVVEPFVYDSKKRYADRHPVRIRAHTSEHGAIDLLVTPDHHMWVAPQRLLSTTRADGTMTSEYATYPYQTVAADQLNVNPLPKLVPHSDLLYNATSDTLHQHFLGWRVKQAAPVDIAQDYSFRLPSMAEMVDLAAARGLDLAKCVPDKHLQNTAYAAHTFQGADMDTFLAFLGMHSVAGSISLDRERAQLDWTHNQHAEFVEGVWTRLSRIERSDGSLLFPSRRSKYWRNRRSPTPATTSTSTSAALDVVEDETDNDESIELTVSADSGTDEVMSSDSDDDGEKAGSSNWHRFWSVPQLVVWLFVANMNTSKQRVSEPLPSWVWLLSPRQVVVLIAGTAHGAGSHSEQQSFCDWCGITHRLWSDISTVNRRHAEQLHALAMHAGMYSTMNVCRRRHRVSRLTGERFRDCYSVTIHQRANPSACTGSECLGRNAGVHIDDRPVTRQQLFWCVTTEESSHVVLVRRRVDDCDKLFPNPLNQPPATKSEYAEGAQWFTAWVGNCERERDRQRLRARDRERMLLLGADAALSLHSDYMSDSSDVSDDMAEPPMQLPTALSVTPPTPPMTVTFRLTGLDGEATEPLVDSLPDDETERVDAEEECDVMRESSDGGVSGLGQLVRRLSAIRDLSHPVDYKLVQVMLKVMTYACQLQGNRRHVLSMMPSDGQQKQIVGPYVLHVLMQQLILSLSAIRHIPAYVLASSSFKDEPAAKTALDLTLSITQLMHALMQELQENKQDADGDIRSTSNGSITTTPLSDDLPQSTPHSVHASSAEHFQSLLSLLHSPSVRAHTPLIDSVIAILPGLTFGSLDLMQLLYATFAPYLSPLPHNELPTDGDSKWWINALIEMLNNTPKEGALGRHIRQFLFDKRIPHSLRQYVAIHKPSDSPDSSGSSDRAVETSEGHEVVKIDLSSSAAASLNEFVELPSLPVVLQLLSGLVAAHPPSQSECSSLIPLLQQLESISSSKRIGSLSEQLLSSLTFDNAHTQQLLADLRSSTKADKQKRAADRRRQLLQRLGINSSPELKGKLVLVADKVSGLKDVQEDDDLLRCCVCQEGYSYKPGQMLGMYVYVKPVHVAMDDTMTMMADGLPLEGDDDELGVCTVTHFNLIHYRCHQEAVKADKKLKPPKSEWDGAMIRNAHTLTNALFPLLLPPTADTADDDVSFDQYAQAVETYWSRFQFSTRLTLPRFMLVMEDIKMLMMRYANEESFSADSRGGGKESNVALLVYLMQMALMCFSQCQIGEGVREAIEKMHRQAVKALIQAGGGAQGPTGMGAEEGAREAKEQEEKKQPDDGKESKDEEKEAAVSQLEELDVDSLRSNGKRRRRKRSSPASTRTTRSRKKQRKATAVTAPASVSLTTEEQRLLEMYTAAAPAATATSSAAAATTALDDDADGMWEHAHLDHWLTILAASLLLNSYEEWTAMRWSAITKLMTLTAQQVDELCSSGSSSDGSSPTDAAGGVNEDTLEEEDRAALLVQRVAACRPVLLFVSLVQQLHHTIHKPPFATPPPPYPPPTAHWSMPPPASSPASQSSPSYAASTALLATRWSFLQRFDGLVIRELQSNLIPFVNKHTRNKHDKDGAAEAAREVEEFMERLGVADRLRADYNGSVESMMRAMFQRKAVTAAVDEESRMDSSA